MPNNCTACTNNSRNTRNISYFSFPRDRLKRRTWLSIIGRYDLINRIGHLKTAPSHYKVCEEHFDSNCFIHNLRLDTNDMTTTTKYKPVKLLSSNALPTLNLRHAKEFAEKASFEQNMNKEIKHISCSYYGCQNTSESFTMFRFPVKRCNREILAIWLQNAGNKHLHRLSPAKLRNKYLCGAHFDKSFIDSGSGTPVLAENAVPFKTLKIMRPVKVYSKRTKSIEGTEGNSMDVEDNDSGRSSVSSQGSDEEYIPYKTRSKKEKRGNKIVIELPSANAQRSRPEYEEVNSDEIRVEVTLEPTEDERVYKTVLYIEVPPLKQCSETSSEEIYFTEPTYSVPD